MEQNSLPREFFSLRFGELIIIILEQGQRGRATRFLLAKKRWHLLISPQSLSSLHIASRLSKTTISFNIWLSVLFYRTSRTQANESSSHLLCSLKRIIVNLEVKNWLSFHGRRTFSGEPTALNFLSLYHYLYMLHCKILAYYFKIFLFVIMYIRVL